jgi:hypothetical protein
MNKITRDDTEHGVEYVRADEAQAEVLEQCRIIAMGAEREDALRAELTRLKASIALDKMAENARDLGLDYEPAVQEPVAWVNHGENRITRATGWDGYGALCKCVCANPPAAQPAVQEKCFLCGERVASCTSDVCPKSAQPAVQEGRDWSLLEATQESLREHMAEIKRLKATQPAPVQHDECVVCGDKVRVIPRPWVGLTETEIDTWNIVGHETLREFIRAIEAKLKEKNHV